MYQSRKYTGRKNTLLCTDFSKLEKTFIRDLKLYETATGKYIEGTLVTHPQFIIGVTTTLEDKHGDRVMLALYNMVSDGMMKRQLVEEKFPVGLKIKISQPFYKVFADGNWGIRVDSPAEILLVEENEQIKDFNEVRRLGKELIKSGETLTALDLYFKGLKNFSNIPALLNNRSQTEIKMGEYEEALLDAAAAFILSTDTENTKANERYQFAAKKLALNTEDKESVMSVWKSVLLREQSRDEKVECGSIKEGNAFFKEGNYRKAKEAYSAVLRNSNVCVLLNNIAVVCLKLNILHTAVCACSAVLQISTSEEYNNKAHYSIAKAFSMMGELELPKLSAKNTDYCLDHFWSQDLDIEKKIIELMIKHSLISLSEGRNDHFTDEKVPSDYIKSDSIQHTFVEGKGRGLRAIKDIRVNELLIVDHLIECVETDRPYIVCSPNNYSSLVTEILNLVKFDGLLGKKILCLETQSKASTDLKLVDLEWMAYRKFHYEVPPFLPQSPNVIKYNKDLLSESFVDNVLNINTFEWKYLNMPACLCGAALMLRISLFNHANDPNCVHIPLGDSMAVFARRNINKSEELTICYAEQTLGKWGL